MTLAGCCCGCCGCDKLAEQGEGRGTLGVASSRAVKEEEAMCISNEKNTELLMVYKCGWKEDGVRGDK